MGKVYLSASKQINNMGNDKITEMYRMEKLCRDILLAIPNEPSNYIRSNKNCDNLYESTNDSNTFNPDYHIALHSNANVNQELQGTIVIYKTLAGLLLASRFINIFKTYFPDREIKIIKDFDLLGFDLAELRKTKAPAILIENFWHDSNIDIKWFNQYYIDVINVYVKFILELIGYNNDLIKGVHIAFIKKFITDENYWLKKADKDNDLVQMFINIEKR